MGALSIWHWLIFGAVLLILFGGRGKIPSLMGDVAKGIKSFKSNMKEEDKAEPDAQKIEEAASEPAVTSARKDEAANS